MQRAARRPGETPGQRQKDARQTSRPYQRRFNQPAGLSRSPWPPRSSAVPALRPRAPSTTAASVQALPMHRKGSAGLAPSNSMPRRHPGGGVTARCPVGRARPRSRRRSRCRGVRVLVWAARAGAARSRAARRSVADVVAGSVAGLVAFGPQFGRCLLRLVSKTRPRRAPNSSPGQGGVRCYSPRLDLNRSFPSPC